jgi:hypothetical protein
MVYAVRITMRVLVAGVVIAATTGLISSLLVNVQIARIEILNDLRD